MDIYEDTDTVRSCCWPCQAPAGASRGTVLWTIESNPNAPGADLIWDKAIAADEMSAQLAPLLSEM